MQLPTRAISIHAPIVGCDTQKAQGEKLDELISIHAPIVGCDQKKATTETVIRYFNPRTHRGVRRMPYYDKRDREQFQSTHPSWGATLTCLFHIQCIGYFNPRTHRGVRRYHSFKTSLIWAISIHAPIVGCDHRLTGTIRKGIAFQSTHPSWGATRKTSLFINLFNNFNPRTHRGVRLYNRDMELLGIIISIHAPIVGCDYHCLRM